jgi:hypothetical protein
MPKKIKNDPQRIAIRKTMGRSATIMGRNKYDGTKRKSSIKK